MNRLLRWLFRPIYTRIWQAGFDAGVEAERINMIRLSMAQRDRWYFVESAGDRDYNNRPAYIMDRILSS